MAEDQRQLLGPIGEVVRANVARLRALRRMTFRELSDRLAEQGRPIPTLGLSRIERGERRVDADDLIALAAVLGVPPGALLLPARDDGEPVWLTSATRLPARSAWEWMLGREPLWAAGRLMDRPEDAGRLEDFQRHVPPFGGRDALWDHTALRAAKDVETRLYALLSQMGRASTEDRIGDIERALRRLIAEADDAIAWAREHRWEDGRGYAAAGEDPARPVIAAIVTSGKGVLVGRRNDRTPPWTFIAGEQEPGEEAADTIIREVKEETGLDIRPGEVIGERDHPATGRHMIYMSARAVRGARVFVADEAELAEVRWVSMAEAEELLPGMFDPVRDFLAATLKG